MSGALKITAVGIICTAVILLIREIRPELAPFVQAGAVVVLTAVIMSYLKAVLNNAEELFDSFSLFGGSYLSLLVRILGIAVITKFGADICEDNGSSVLKTGVELAGKVLILAMCFPMIEAVVKFAAGLIK